MNWTPAVDVSNSFLYLYYLTFQHKKIKAICNQIEPESLDQNFNESNSNVSRLQPPERYSGIIMLSSDKGLCGTIHTSILKHVESIIAQNSAFSKIPLITIGEKQLSCVKK